MLGLTKFSILFYAAVTFCFTVPLAYSAQAKNDVAIWSPDNVNWWVAAGSEVDDLCQIHWLYDDEINVYFKQNGQNLFYFGFEHLGSQKNLRNSFKNEDFIALLVVDDRQINLGVARLDANKFIATASRDLNELDVFSRADSLFLKSDKTLYSFPFENVKENFDVYTKCLKDKGQYVNREAAIKPVASMELNSPQKAQAISRPASVSEDLQNSANIDAREFGVNNEVPSLAMEEASMPTSPESVDDLTLPPSLSDRLGREELKKQVAGLSKSGAEFLDDDLSYDLIKNNKNKLGHEDDKECESAAIGSNVNAVIKNLTRKLTILEREKEKLRMKVLAQGDRPVISEILSCKNSGLGEVDVAEANEGVIEEYKNLIEGFKTQIEGLEAENELLNASIVDKPSIGDISEIPQIAELKESVRSLEIENIQLNKELEEYKTMLEENVPKSVLPEPADLTAIDSKQNSLVDEQILPSETNSKQNSLVDEQILPSEDVVPLENELEWENIEKEALELISE